MPSRGLTITNPLVLYRALLATKRIEPDPAQHRLALHLQKLYYRLKDYQPEVDYGHKLAQIGSLFKRASGDNGEQEHSTEQFSGESRSVFTSFREQKRTAEAKALTRILTDHESAVQLKSPQGLLLYGEVGTGKSLLVDLLADCLPNRKKRRWHFNTFMLDIFARLEHLRKGRLVASPAGTTSKVQDEENSLLLLARDMISTSPILFLDEFQLPDRASSKILSNLFTSFFQLGGVLIATSNRMPEELANASGIEFPPPPATRLGILGKKWGLLGSRSDSGKSENMFAGKGDFSAFLEVLRARCEIWDMEGGRDWRRREADEDGTTSFGPAELDMMKVSDGFEGLEPMISGNLGLGYEQSRHVKSKDEDAQVLQQDDKFKRTHPRYFHINSSLSTSEESTQTNETWRASEFRCVHGSTGLYRSDIGIPWESTLLRVYGRNLVIPRCLAEVCKWTFNELCSANLGPADYITIASTFHTVILTDVPILNLLQKNEARRFITLLDALYEARCKLLIGAEAGPDEIFFPETMKGATDKDRPAAGGDGIYPETFSEIYQDQTSPFRPNISSYTSSASPPSYDSSVLPSSPSQASAARSILADKDSDFGPVYGAGRSRGPSDGAPGAGNEIGRQSGLDFSRTEIFTGEDERFAYKRARSRLWEMCGSRWWAREGEDWWRPLGKDVRHWEGDSAQEFAFANGNNEPTGPLEEESGEEKKKDEGLFRHGASPFRTSPEAPPKFGWQHAWGMMTWGRKAGSWGKGPEGLVERRKGRSDRVQDDDQKR